MNTVSNFSSCEEDDVLSDLGALPVEESERRPTCDRCTRPTSVCLCPYLPSERAQVSTNLYIIQHPHEEVRVLRTVPILDISLPQDKVHVIRGRRFNRHALLDKITSYPNTLLLFPGPGAVDLQSIPLDSYPSYNLILIDGTWPQARGIYSNNRFLHRPKQVKLSLNVVSEYVIRTQPTDAALSTLEAAAFALSVLENKPELIEILTKPLRALCDFQLEHGAVPHQSKEYLKKNGLCKKKIPSNQRKNEDDS
ncbi:tRNA-uridine aminocarboxypropyltransferase 2-like [Ptychodera flava]|uniref:tRNA-uridine aminocarboxypropyltransferase 2-like n=1 Tax=Ptychodera flava TaxID=63121 RepID=UPI003969F5E2